MTDSAPTDRLGTHDVLNQPAPRGDRNLWSDDVALRAALPLPAPLAAPLADYGALLGRAEMRQAARDAHRHLPELALFDSGGRRLDEVRYHPAYHGFMARSVAAGYAGIAWDGTAPGHGHACHAAMVYMASQVEPGHCCPLTMSYAAIPVLRQGGGVLAGWDRAVLSRDYDPSVRPLADKRGATIGMAMTEKQGGSDLRAITTQAVADGAQARLTGHKWFCSAPMSDAFLTLARTPEGLGCFLVPRWLEGARNGIRLQRLKDKLGNRSNASAEIEYDGALAYPVGPPGRGVATIIEMVQHTRLDTALAPAGLMRAALGEAHHWTTHRTAFGASLIDQPLMRTLLADLTLDWEAALALGLRVARAFDGTAPEDRAFARIAVALAKYLANKLCPGVVVEAMEALGGMGYVEDTPLPMLYREAPLNSIWEGSGNVICLDVLRSLGRDPLAAEMLGRALSASKGADRQYDTALAAWRSRWPGPVPEAEARWFVEATATLLAASQLLQTAPRAVAEGYVQSRLTRDRGRLPGAVAGLDTGAILSRLSS